MGRGRGELVGVGGGGGGTLVSNSGRTRLTA